MTDHADLVCTCPLVIRVSSFREMFISILCPLLKWAVFLVGLYSSLYILDKGSPPYTVCKYFLHSVGYLFMFLMDDVLGSTDFNSESLFFVCLCHWSYLRNHGLSMVTKVDSYFFSQEFSSFLS